MRCGGCGAEARAGVRFCEQCGAAVGGGCPSCGAATPPDARFCGQCGIALGESAHADTPVTSAERDETSEHKPVTALFCDIVDSTGLAERLGSEAVHRILDRFFRIALEEVERYGGTVDKFLGDGFLALV